MKMANAIKLVVAVGVSLSAGAIGSIFTASSVSGWYRALETPALNPPAWVFGPVWTVLYVLMGTAAFLVWSAYAKATDGQARRKIWLALSLFGVQLVLNGLWSFLFFGAQRPGWALIEIVVLWCAIAATIVAFWRVSRPAAYLLIPYLAWVSFATYLNHSIFILN